MLKTMKESEKRLLFGQGVLENYYKHIMESDGTLLSKIFGIYQIRVRNMQEVTCFIMDNVLG